MNKTAALYMTGAIAVVAILCFGAVKTTPTRTPVGYYDGERVYGGSREAKSAFDGVEASVKEARATAERATADYQAAEKKSKDSVVVGADQALAAKRQVAEDAGAAYTRAKEKANAAIAVEVDRRIADAVNRLAAQRGMTLVFPTKGKLPFAAPEADLTSDVVAAVDAGGPVR